jgi:group I intron endonuclease
MCRKHYSRFERHGDPLWGEDALPVSTPGVYSITCLINGWVYIGSSQSVRVRWNGHRSHLRNHWHNAPQVQADWDKYGPDAFRCDLVAVVHDKDERLATEQAHLDVAWATEKCYNVSPSVAGHYTLNAEQRQRLSAAMTGKPKSAEHRANLWQDREVTPEFTEQMRRNGQAGKGRPKPDEQRRKMSETQLAGRPVLTEAIVREIKQLIAAGERGNHIARKFGITPGAVSSIKAGRNWAHVTLDDPEPAEPGQLAFPT